MMLDELFGINDKDITEGDFSIVPGEYGEVAAQDHEHFSAVFLFDIADEMSRKGTFFGDEYLADFFYIGKGLFAVKFTGIALNEACADDTCRYCHDTDTEQGYKDTHYTACRSYRVDIAVADGQEGGDTPPHTGEGIIEGFGLSFMFSAVDTEGGSEHKHKDYKDRGEYLIFLFHDNFDDNGEGVASRIDTEQVENTHDAQYPECHEARKVEKRQDSKEVNNAVKGHKEAKACGYTRLFFIEDIGSPDTKGIFYCEKEDGNALYDLKSGHIRGEVFKCFKHHTGDIEHDSDCYKDIKSEGGKVALCTYLDNIENTFFEVFQNRTALQTAVDADIFGGDIRRSI